MTAIELLQHLLFGSVGLFLIGALPLLLKKLPVEKQTREYIIALTVSALLVYVVVSYILRPLAMFAGSHF